jgi:hypothetical protein
LLLDGQPHDGRTASSSNPDLQPSPTYFFLRTNYSGISGAQMAFSVAGANFTDSTLFTLYIGTNSTNPHPDASTAIWTLVVVNHLFVHLAYNCLHRQFSY